jgi:hypothetical protein
MGSSPIKYLSRVTPSVGQNDQSLRHSFLRHLHAEHLHFGLPHPRLHYRPVPAECAFCATLANCRDENDDGTDHSLFKLSPTLPHVCVPSPTARATSWQPSGGGIADQLIGTMAGAAHRGWVGDVAGGAIGGVILTLLAGVIKNVTSKWLRQGKQGLAPRCGNKCGFEPQKTFSAAPAPEPVPSSTHPWYFQITHESRHV